MILIHEKPFRTPFWSERIGEGLQYEGDVTMKRIDWDMNCQYKEWYLQLQFWFILRGWSVRGVGGVGGKGVGGWEGEEREGARSYPTGDDSSPLQFFCAVADRLGNRREPHIVVFSFFFFKKDISAEFMPLQIFFLSKSKNSVLLPKSFHLVFKIW